MNTYIALIRGINVGGKNKMPMAKLKTVLEEEGFSDVSTYIASGNVILHSKKKALEVQEQIKKNPTEKFHSREQAPQGAGAYQEAARVYYPE